MISIIIPTFNEENYLKECLSSVLKFRRQEKILKIFVVDGVSSDKTIEIIKFFRLKDERIELIENPKKYQSFALNLGIKRAKTKYIMRLDAHSQYPEDYVENCLLAIKRSGADNVGGIFISKLKTNSFQELVVASITTSVFGVGSSSFRIKHTSGFVKTVPYGFFRRRVFKEIGLFNERLIRNQDYEFNRRMILNGMKIWLDRNIKVFYFNKTSLVNFYKKQFFQEGRFNVYMWYIAPYTYTLRHSATLFFFVLLILTALLTFVSQIPIVLLFVVYFFSSLIASFVQSIKYKNIMLIFALPFSFLLFHLLHGASSFYGLCNILFNKDKRF
tara:strand:+ start:960 stop:1949 length:990 start_codon:yes stop_codon:yes gene_type:complete